MITLVFDVRDEPLPNDPARGVFDARLAVLIVEFVNKVTTALDTTVEMEVMDDND